MTFRAKPVVKRDHRPSWETRGRRNLYLNIGFTAVVVIAVLILIGAAGASYYDDHFGMVAKVNGQTITKDDLRARVGVDSFRLNWSEAQIRNAMNTGLMTQTQASQQLSSLQQEAQNLPQTSLNRLIDATLQAQLAVKENVAVTDAQVDKQLTVEATTPEERHIWVIAVTPVVASGATAPTDAQKTSAQAKIDSALAQLKAGKKWEDVAKSMSGDPSAVQGGDLGWTTQQGSPLDQAFVDALFALPANGMTGILTGADGTLRIGRVTEIRAAKVDANYQTAITDAGVSLDDYRKALKADLLRTALSDKITADATTTATPQRHVAEIYLQGAPGSTAADEVKSAHILISPKHDPQNASSLAANDPAWAQAKTEADAIYAQLQKDPTQFATIAKEKSDDKSSGADGGTLPWFKQADVDPSFGKAVFASGLTVGQILPPVKSQFGWHIIRFDGRRPDASIRIGQLHDQAVAPNADFAALAKANSDAPDASNGGDMGWIAHNQVDKAQEDVIFATPVGSVSKVLTTQSGWYVFKVLEEQSRVPTGDQLVTLKNGAFTNWYAAQKAAATIETIGGTSTLPQSS